MATVLALDVGDKRIGVAKADVDVRIASPLVTIAHDAQVWATINNLVDETAAQAIVVGLPRNLNGDDTPQTAKARTFMAQLRANIGLPVHEQDEAATSVKAEEELRARGKHYDKSDIDALAATYILEDYLQEVKS